ncbi:uncharacterized protein LOC122506110 [Leptopilina heterotoma]|uniref:uncharacterized protein LOC122506110 n=1 Tax=Leptopilina heterotoma TaxID=63436 RepID=UPI001CAA37C0|nr:uncharacterized protein LOC122506110 [Leptopilina heterotoma]
MKGTVGIFDNPFIPDSIYSIQEQSVTVPVSNNSSSPKHLNLNDIQYRYITSDVPKPGAIRISVNELAKRIKLLNDNTRVNHVETRFKENLLKIIHSYHDIFRLPGDPLPGTHLAHHKITLKEDKIINTRSYQPPKCHEIEVSTQIGEMFDAKILRHSNSPYNSPVWIVPKKTDASGKKKWRVVIDFRKINEITDQDSYPIPVIDDIIYNLGNAKFFSAFDLSSGFHQVPMEESSKKFTAFSTPDGHFEFERMPFGLKNSPATFQRMINTALNGLINKICMVYLDDIVVYGSSIEEHNKNLVLLFERLRHTGLKLQPDKCEFLRPELEYLGHLVTKDGIKPNPNKTKAVSEFKVPHNRTSLKSFLGLSGYYRKFIKNYSTIAKPLTELTKESKQFIWTPDCQKAFDTLKLSLCQAPVLKYPNFEKEFTLITDASNVGLGAILSQDGHPCYYISRTLNAPELNYTTTEKELLAIVWAVQRFRQFLLGRKFKILTDHQALKWLFNVKDASSRLMRWRLKLEEYDYEIQYKKGSENTAADALSRVHHVNSNDHSPPLNSTEFDLESELPDIEISDTQLERELNTPIPVIQNTPNRESVANEFTDVQVIDTYQLSSDWGETQTNTDNISQNSNVPPITEEDQQLYKDYYKWFTNRTETREVEKPNANGKLWKAFQKRQTDDPDIRILPPFNEKNWLKILNGTAIWTLSKRLSILRMHFNDPTITSTEKIKLKILISFISYKYPELKILTCYNPNTELSAVERRQIIEESHGSVMALHFGENKSIQRARELGIWKNMEVEIIDFIKKCHTCQTQKLTRIKRKSEAIIPDTPVEPNDKIAMDIFGPLPITSEANEYILSIQDMLTKYIILIPLKDVRSETIIEKLFDHYIYTFGSPKHILTDQGQNLVSELMQNFENLFKIKHVKTTTFHPQSNGSLERTHGTIKDLIRTAMTDLHTEWDRTLQFICMAYNTMQHEGTGFSPFQLTFGRNANIPSILATTPSLKYSELVKLWQERHERYIGKARDKIQQSKEKYKRIQDAKIILPQRLFEIGDLVMIVNNKENKLSPDWKGPATILKILPNNNYEIIFNNERTNIHADRLKLYNY